MKPLVSVIVPTYNQEQYIISTLQSINNQLTDFYFEVLVGDDCSTDNTGELCKQFSMSNPHVQFVYVRNEKNLGLMGNWKAILLIAKGKYLAVCEGDDYWTDTAKLQKQVTVLENDPTLAICFHQTRYFQSLTNESIKISPTKMQEKTTILDLAIYNYIDNVSVVCRNLSENGKYPEWVFADHLPVPDYLWHMYNAQFGDIYFINEVMADYRVREDSIWSSVSYYSQAINIVSNLITPLKENIQSVDLHNNLDIQVLNILFSYSFPENKEDVSTVLKEKCLNLVSKENLFNYMLKRSQELNEQIDWLKKSTTFKVGAAVLAPLRIFKKGK